MASLTGWRTLGVGAFFVGYLIAVITGIIAGYAGETAAVTGGITLVLVILGLIVGFFNISDKENMNFLLAVIALSLVGLLTNLMSINVIIPTLGSILQSVVQRIAEFVTPAALVVALRVVYKLSKPPL